MLFQLQRIFLLETNSKCTICREAETLFNKLAKYNFRPSYTGLRRGIQNTIVRNSFSELPVSPCKYDGAGKGVGTERNREDAEKGSNNTSGTRSRAISRLNYHSFKEIRWFSSGYKPEETELLC